MFDDIRPYTDAEIAPAMQRICADSHFPVIAGYIFPGTPVGDVRDILLSCSTIYDFQVRFMLPVIESIEEKTTDGVSVDGLESLDPDEARLYVSNHRDIVLDAAFLQVFLHKAGLPTSEISFGANLMHGDIVVDLGKANRMFKVERPTTVESPREFVKSSHRLSEYLHYVLHEEGNSLWIAQRNGRTKDGKDRTDKGIIKMFSLWSDSDKAAAIASMNIVPISVSYEWEPCELMKAVELYIKESFGSYKKKPGEDLSSILNGITSPKGRVHFQVCGKVRAEDLAPFASLPGNAFNQKVAELIDRRIILAYRLYPNNYVAYDLRRNSPVFQDRYSARDRECFLDHLERSLLSLPDEIRNDQDMVSRLREILLDIYASPVESRLNLS